MVVIDQMAADIRRLIADGRERVFWLIALRRVAFELDSRPHDHKHKTPRPERWAYRVFQPEDCD